jgi:hypothetical protein
VEKLVQWVDELKQMLNIPMSIQAAGVEEADFLARVDQLAEAAFDDQCTGANPRYPLISELSSCCWTATMATPGAKPICARPPAMSPWCASPRASSKR